MIVGLMRHGRAEPLGGDERRLTPDGVLEVEQVARALPFKPRLVYSSPLRRAVETAEIVARIHGVEVVIHEGLRPGLFTSGIFEGLAEDRVLMVGHNPSISEVASRLSGCGVDLGTGWVAVVEGRPWRLAALVPPPGSLG